MKLNLKKKQLKNLSNDQKALPAALTPQIGGASGATAEKPEPAKTTRCTN
ncbi:hypothetical protein [Thalassomonas actiniarum]|uniref:Uncharacterized protein n=1 Tax=Thalassomonas actiniarum TaxID=485447 RepID=A0AAE9YV04_9GAMM|nr:hypothetical protein [Thalassomonas actiniarum]WDE01323.1 hypothetical protein SG35_012180 [Thalassomonas actiniarum]